MAAGRGAAGAEEDEGRAGTEEEEKGLPALRKKRRVRRCCGRERRSGWGATIQPNTEPDGSESQKGAWG